MAPHNFDCGCCFWIGDYSHYCGLHKNWSYEKIRAFHERSQSEPYYIRTYNDSDRFEVPDSYEIIKRATREVVAGPFFNIKEAKKLLEELFHNYFMEGYYFPWIPQNCYSCGEEVTGSNKKIFYCDKCKPKATPGAVVARSVGVAASGKLSDLMKHNYDLYVTTMLAAGQKPEPQEAPEEKYDQDAYIRGKWLEL